MRIIYTLVYNGCHPVQTSGLNWLRKRNAFYHLFWIERALRSNPLKSKSFLDPSNRGFSPFMFVPGFIFFFKFRFSNTLRRKNTCEITIFLHLIGKLNGCMPFKTYNKFIKNIWFPRVSLFPYVSCEKNRLLLYFDCKWKYIYILKNK